MVVIIDIKTCRRQERRDFHVSDKMREVKYGWRMPRIHFISLGLFLPGSPSLPNRHVYDPYVQFWGARSVMGVPIQIDSWT